MFLSSELKQTKIQTTQQLKMNTKMNATKNDDKIDNADFETWADFYGKEQGWNLCFCTIA